MTTKRVVAGPFVLAKASGKLPSGVLTVSECLADIVPDIWTIEWAKVESAERVTKGAAFGIGAHRLGEAIRWTTDHLDGGGFAWANVFLNLEAAREFRRRFVTTDVRLLQMSLPEEHVEPFLEITAPPPQQPGCAPVGSVGVHDAIKQRVPLTSVGQRRGFEVLGFDGAAGFDSFRCNGLEADFQRLCGAEFNEWGLIDDPAVAARCAEYANGPEVRTCAVAWHPWLITEHLL